MLFKSNLVNFGVPYGSRTRVAAVKGRCPRPLDERDAVGWFTASGLTYRTGSKSVKRVWFEWRSPSLHLFDMDRFHAMSDHPRG